MSFTAAPSIDSTSFNIPGGATKARDSIGTVSTVSSASSAQNDDDSDVVMPWEEDDDWVPCSKSGKEKTPKQIRNELQKYIDECKTKGTMSQSELVKNVMGLSYSSFSKFMNPKSYKDPWSGVQNKSYWEAAKLLERVKIEKQLTKMALKNVSSGKRKAKDTSIQSSDGGCAKKAKNESRQKFF